MDIPDLFPELDTKETEIPDLFPELDSPQPSITNTTSMGWPAGGKYSPEQMKALDSGRASLLNEELSKAKASGDLQTQQQLEQELAIFNNKTQGQFVNVKSIPAPVKPDTPSMELPTLDKSSGDLDLFPELSAPSTPNFVMNRLTRGILGFPTTAMEAAAGAASLAAGEGAGDLISKGAKYVDTFAKRSWGITEEQDKGASFGQNILGAGAQFIGTLPYFAVGRISGAAMMAANPAVEMGKSLVDAGVDVNKARDISMMVGGAYGLLMKVGTSFAGKPGESATDVIKKYVLSSAATGGFNTAQGAVERYSISRWLEDSDPEVSKNFKWDDLEAAGIDFTLGALLGPAAKYFGDTNKSKMDIFNDMKKNRELHASMSKELMEMVRTGAEFYSSDTSKRDHWKYRFDLLSEADAKAAFEGLEKQFSFTPSDLNSDVAARTSGSGVLTLDNYLHGIKFTDEYKDLNNAGLVAALRALTRIGNQLGFSNIQVHIMDGMGTNYRGAYSSTVYAKQSSGDHIFIPKVTSRDNLGTIVHEVAHAVTSNILYAFETGTYPPEMAGLYDKYLVIRENYDKYRVKALEDLANKLPLSDQAALKNMINDASPGGLKISSPTEADYIYSLLEKMVPNDIYGLANLDEGISTIFDGMDPTKHATQSRRGWEYAENLSSKIKENNTPVFESMKERTPLIQELWTDVWKEIGKLSSDVTDSPFLKTMYADIFNFAEEIPNYYIDRKYLNNVAQLLSIEEMHKYISIASILDQSSSDIERIDKLLALSDDPEWRIMLKERPEIILENTAKFKAQAEIYLEELKKRSPEAGLDKKLSEGGEMYFPYKDLDQFMKDREIELLNAWDFDRPLKEKFFGPDQLKFMDKKNPLTKLLNFVFKLQRDYEGMQARQFYDIMSHVVLYKKLSEKEQMNVMKFASAVDSDAALRTQMAKDGKYWMDKVEISDYANKKWKSGVVLSEREQWAYWDIGNAMARTWDLIDSIRAKQGLGPIERLPNYMPHMWKGAYKVFVQTKETLPNGTTRNKTIALRGFNFKQEAQNYANKMRAKGFEIKPNDSVKYLGKDWHVVEMHDFENGIIPSIMQNLEAYKNFTFLDPNAQAHLVDADASSIVGFMSHDLVQTGVHGYVNDAFPKGYDLRDVILGKKYRDKVDTLNLFESYVKNVTDHWKNVMYVHDVHKKLIGNPYDPTIDTNKYYGNTMSRFRNFQKFMDMQVRNYTGEAVNAFKTFDQALINGSVAVGIPPYLYRQGIKSVRNLMSIVFTRYNPGNWAFNYLQPLQTFGVLSFVDSRRRLNGLSSANLNDVISEVKTAFNSGNAELGRALDWARENHILDAQAEYQVRSKEAKTQLGRIFQKVNLSEVPTRIEADARETSFALSFMYWKKVLGDPVLAAEAAVETMGTSMVNYDRSKRPLMYQSYGVIGEMLSPFAVYRNAYFGNMAMMMKHALSNPTEFHAWKPFLVSNALFMLTAGMVGSIGFSEYDSIVRLLKKFAPETFGDMKESSATLIELGIPEPIRLGALASLTRTIPGLPEGSYISGSGSIVGVDDLFDPNIVPFLTSIAGLLEITGKKAVGMSVTNEDLYEALSGVLPGQLKYPLERMFQEEDVSTSFAAKKLTGSTRRSYGDVASQVVMGKKSIKEADEKLLIRQTKAIGEAHNKAVKKLVELATDDLMGGSSQHLDDYYSRAQDLGISSEEFSKKIFDKRLERILPAMDKVFQGGDNPILADKLSEYVRKFYKGRGDIRD